MICILLTVVNTKCEEIESVNNEWLVGWLLVTNHNVPIDFCIYKQSVINRQAGDDLSGGNPDFQQDVPSLTMKNTIFFGRGVPKRG